LGMGKIRGELEDLAFRQLEPQAFEDVKKAVESRRKVSEEFLEEVRALVDAKLREHSIPARIDGRIKRLFSIWQKLKKQHINIDQVYDLLAIRILTDSVKNSDAALGVIHNAWRPVPGRIKLCPEEDDALTRKGKVTRLTRDATPLDFAYAIHTEVAHHCVGANVNGRIVPWKYKLRNGDIVVIHTQPNHTPSRDWLAL